MSINNIGTSIPIQTNFGGTGNSTLTANGVLYGNNAGNIGVTSVGTASQLLTSNGGALAPSFQPNPLINSDFVYVSTIGFPAPSSSTAFINLPTNYGTYVFIFNVITTGSTGTTSGIYVQLSVNNGASWIQSPNTNPFQEYYQKRINMGTGGITFNDAVGAGGLGGGFPFGDRTTQFNTSWGEFTLSGLHVSGIPSWTGKYNKQNLWWVGQVKNGPIVANAFRMVNNSWTNARGSISIFRLRTV